MTQMPMNIFDLLMGDLSNTVAGPVTGHAASTGGTPGLFESLINGYLAPQTGTVAEMPAGFLAGQPGVAKPPSNETLAVVDELVARVSDNWPGAVPENVAAFNRQLLSILPRQTGVIRAAVRDTLTSQLAELEPGQYDILSARVENGSIAMEIVAKDAPGKAIKLTVPADVFASQVDARMGGQSAPRVALGTETYRIDNLLSQLNLKELHVEASAKAQDPVNSVEPVKITLVAETSAGEQLIRAKLDRSRVQITESDICRVADGSKSSAGKPLTANPVMAAAKVYTPLGIYNREGAAARTITNLSTMKADSWSGWADSDAGTRSADGRLPLDTLFGYEAKSADKVSAAGKTMPENVRFNLPENLATSLGVNGRAVTIKLEPEHLGPARLSLSMYDDRLKARIVVESAPAKMALEENLDRLVNELNKAGIEVDRIEITINNGDAHNQMLNRQSNWRHRVATRLPRLDAASSEGTEIPIVPPPAASDGYAGPRGVNILA